MLIDIDKIVVGDRIRRDFGDIQELADDIKDNTLLNALVVTPNGDGNYLLIAGERRLRACRMLGYKAVPVNTVGVEDAEQALMMEISENECRKEFTKTERLEYARRLALIEGAKAKERMSEGGKGTQDIAGVGEARAKVAQALGTNRETLRQEQFIADNADLLDPADFADWDEGKLSTNKAYQRIRAAKEQAERERDMAREDAEGYADDIKSLQEEVAALEKQADRAYEDGFKAASRTKQPQVVTREVESDAARKRISELEHERDVYLGDLQRMRRRNEDMRAELDKARGMLGERQRNDSAQWDIEALTAATNNYLRQYGGKAWAFDQFYRVDEAAQAEFVKAINNLAAFAQNLAQMIREQTNE